MLPGFPELPGLPGLPGMPGLPVPFPVGPGGPGGFDIDLGEILAFLREPETIFALDAIFDVIDIDPLDDLFTNEGLTGLLALGAVFEILFELGIKIGVSVERDAFGIDGTFLDQLTEETANGFGPEAAAVLIGLVEAIIPDIGEGLLGEDVVPITLPPEFDVSNGVADIAKVEIPTGFYAVDIGDPTEVGDLPTIILGLVDEDADDSDVFQLISKIVTGVSGANLDLNTEPGIDGVTLLDIDKDRYTLGIEDSGGDVTDIITFFGEGVAEDLAALATPLDLTDADNALSFVDVDGGAVNLGVDNPLSDLVGESINSVAELEVVVNAVVTGSSPAVELIGYDEDTLSFIVTNAQTGGQDWVVLHGDRLAEILETLDLPPLDFHPEEPDAYV
ncbi:MAG: hypothetical protein ACFBSD_11920 [Paracoccaceae bacterium]